MGQTGWRLPDDLLKRVRVHCAETGERQNEFVRQALEKALAPPSRTPANETGSESATYSIVGLRTTPAKKPAAPLGKGFVPPRPKAK